MILCVAVTAACQLSSNAGSALSSYIGPAISTKKSKYAIKASGDDDGEAIMLIYKLGRVPA